MAVKPIRLATSYPAIVGAVLANERIKANLTQAEAAKRIRLAASTLSRIEAGQSALTVEQLAQLAIVFKCSRTSFILVRADTIASMALRRGIEVMSQSGLVKGVKDGLLAEAAPSVLLALRH